MDVNCPPVSTTTDSATHNYCEVDTRSTDELEEEIAELRAHIDAATYRLLRAIAEFDRREECGSGFQSTAHWLVWRVDIDLVTAREKVQVARAVEGLPRISESFRQGKVSYCKVRAMTRIATAENEGNVLYIVENRTASHVESVVRAYRSACQGEEQEEAWRQREDRYLEMYTDDDGMVVIRGRLPANVGAVLEKALEAAMDAPNDEEKKEGDGGRDPDDRSVTIYDSAESSGECGSAILCDSAEPSEGSVWIQNERLPTFRGLTEAPHDSAESSGGDRLAQSRVDALGLLAEAALGKGLARTERGGPIRSWFTSVRTFWPTDPITAVRNWVVGKAFQRKRADASPAKLLM